MSIWTHIRLFDHPKMRNWWCRESDVSSGRMTLLTHFRPLEHPKMWLGWGRKTDSHLILDLWTSSKYVLDEVEKAMFQGLEWHSQLIFEHWASWKCNFVNTKSNNSSCRQSGGTHFLSLDQPKCNLAEVEKAMFPGVACQFDLIFGLWPSQNATRVIPKKRCFKASNGLVYFFSAPTYFPIEI